MEDLTGSGMTPLFFERLLNPRNSLPHLNMAGSNLFITCSKEWYPPDFVKVEMYGVVIYFLLGSLGFRQFRFFEFQIFGSRFYFQHTLFFGT